MELKSNPDILFYKQVAPTELGIIEWMFTAVVSFDEAGAERDATGKAF